MSFAGIVVVPLASAYGVYRVTHSSFTHLLAIGVVAGIVTTLAGMAVRELLLRFEVRLLARILAQVAFGFIVFVMWEIIHFDGVEVLPAALMAMVGFMQVVYQETNDWKFFSRYHQPLVKVRKTIMRDLARPVFWLKLNPLIIWESLIPQSVAPKRHRFGG